MPTKGVTEISVSQYKYDTAKSNHIYKYTWQVCLPDTFQWKLICFETKFIFTPSNIRPPKFRLAASLVTVLNKGPPVNVWETG